MKHEKVDRSKAFFFNDHLCLEYVPLRKPTWIFTSSGCGNQRVEHSTEQSSAYWMNRCWSFSSNRRPISVFASVDSNLESWEVIPLTQEQDAQNVGLKEIAPRGHFRKCPSEALQLCRHPHPLHIPVRDFSRITKHFWGLLSSLCPGFKCKISNTRPDSWKALHTGWLCFSRACLFLPRAALVLWAEVSHLLCSHKLAQIFGHIDFARPSFHCEQNLDVARNVLP